MTTGVAIEDLGTSLETALDFAASTTTDLPFVLLIDTSRGREVHVTRDDGPVLSDIAEAAKARGMIVGLALDDDIAGADGMNSSIASSYTIDFLDQEHLFKILNAFVFAKREQMRPVLHDGRSVTIDRERNPDRKTRAVPVKGKRAIYAGI